MVKRLIITGSVCVVIALSILFGGTVFIQNQHDKQQRQAQITKAACLAVNSSNATLKNLLVFFEGRTLQSPTITQAQRTKIVAFYQSAIETIPAPTLC